MHYYQLDADCFYLTDGFRLYEIVRHGKITLTTIVLDESEVESVEYNRAVIDGLPEVKDVPQWVKEA